MSNESSSLDVSKYDLSATGIANWCRWKQMIDARVIRRTVLHDLSVSLLAIRRTMHINSRQKENTFIFIYIYVIFITGYIISHNMIYYYIALHYIIYSIKGTLRRRIAYIFLVHLESIYYEIFFYSKIVPNCAVAK